jgi:hypothetical protein
VSSRSPYHCPVSRGSSLMFPLVEDPTAIQALNFDPRCPNVLEDVYRFATFLCAHYCLCILYHVYLDVDTYLMHNVTCFKILWVLLCSCLSLHECWGGGGVTFHSLKLMLNFTNPFFSIVSIQYLEFALECYTNSTKVIFSWPNIDYVIPPQHFIRLVWHMYKCVPCR